MSLDELETPTAEELKELAGKGFGRCQVSYVVSIRLGKWRNVGRERTCRRRAQHVILVICTEHGDERLRICGFHLKLFDDGVMTPRCSFCSEDPTVTRID
jgi:hypothetical protein